MENIQANSRLTLPGTLAKITHWLGYGVFIVLFASTGIDKWIHFAQFLEAVTGYVLVPAKYAQTVAVFVALFELWLACGFIVPACRRMAAGMASVLLFLFAAALWTNYHFGVLAPCGCWFSVTLSQATLPHVVFDLFLAGVACTLWLEAPRLTDSLVTFERGDLLER
jgi:hypothetical protein